MDMRDQLAEPASNPSNLSRKYLRYVTTFPLDHRATSVLATGSLRSFQNETSGLFFDNFHERAYCRWSLLLTTQRN